MKSKQQTKTKNSAKMTPRQVPGNGFMRRFVLVLLGILLVFLTMGGSWAFFEFVVWNKLPAELVGKWVVVEGPQDGATFDFFRNGTMVGKVNLGGREGIINATIRVDGKNLYSTTRHPQTGQDDTRVQVIRTLTAKELVLEDEQGNLLKMERAE